MGLQGIPRWVHKTFGKIMELLKTIISFCARSKKYEYLERGVQWWNKAKSILAIALITLVYL
jgi:hypothetical protein